MTCRRGEVGRAGGGAVSRRVARGGQVGKQAGRQQASCCILGSRSCQRSLGVQSRGQTASAHRYSKQAGRRRQQAAHPPPVALVHHGHPLRHLAVAKRAFVHPVRLPAALTANQGRRRGLPPLPTRCRRASSDQGRRSLRGACHLASGRPAGNVRRCRESGSAALLGHHTASSSQQAARCSIGQLRAICSRAAAV